jgi:hypothetical protein
VLIAALKALRHPKKSDGIFDRVPPGFAQAWTAEAAIPT